VIESKREIYRAHSSSICILLVRQDRAEIIVDRRTAEGWRSQVQHAVGELALPEFGLACSVRKIYRNARLLDCCW
jgi:hypothetical protein